MDVASETMELFRRHAAREQRNAAAAALAAAEEPAGQETPSSSSQQQQQQQQQQQDGSSIQQQQSPSQVKQQQQAGSSSSSSSVGGGVDVVVTVLTQAHWPTQARLNLNLPSVSCQGSSYQDQGSRDQGLDGWVCKGGGWRCTIHNPDVDTFEATVMAAVRASFHSASTLKP
jgi:hypothetical protein